jgi:hypothetical protein
VAQGIDPADVRKAAKALIDAASPEERRTRVKGATEPFVKREARRQAALAAAAPEMYALLRRFVENGYGRARISDLEDATRLILRLQR